MEQSVPTPHSHLEIMEKFGRIGGVRMASYETSVLSGSRATRYDSNFSVIRKNMEPYFVRMTLNIWSYRLTVRTPGFHPGNPGSIPGRITKVNTSPCERYLLW